MNIAKGGANFLLGNITVDDIKIINNMFHGKLPSTNRKFATCSRI